MAKFITGKDLLTEDSIDIIQPVTFANKKIINEIMRKRAANFKLPNK